VIGGKNKYMVNGHTAQASQVQNLFHSVQLNVNNPHFLIMQGRITKVLNMKPPEILGMIEEAAGTRMFENKKQNALKTIEKKQAKVDEINSILTNEITPTLERLRGEKTHYLKWSANNTEMERLERFCVAYEFAMAEKTVEESQEELAGMQSQEAELIATSKEAKQALAVNAKEVEHLSGQHEAMTDGAYKAAVKTEEALSKDLVKSTTEQTNKRAELARELKALEAMKKGGVEISEALAAKRAQIEAGAEELKAVEEAAAAAAEAASALQAEYRDMCAGVGNTSNEESLTLTDQIAAATAKAEECQAKAEQDVLRIKHLKATVASLRKEVKDTEKSVAGLAKDRAAAAARVASMEGDLASQKFDEGELRRLQGVCDEEEPAIGRLREQVEGLEAQLAGRLNFDYASPSRDFDRSKVKGLVAKLVQIKDPAHATALEVAAGGKLYQVVVDSEVTGKELLQKGKLRRRVTIIPLNKISEHRLQSSQLSRAALVAAKQGGTATCAVELVGYDQDLSAAMSFVFGSTLVCESLEVAKSVAFDKGVRTRTVTLDGDSFEPQGTLTGGSKANLGAVLGQLRSLSDASTELGVRQERFRAASSQLKRLESAINAFDAASQKVEIEREKLAQLDKQLSLSTHSQLSARLAESETGLAEAEEGVEVARKGKKDAEAKVASLRADEANFRQRREQLLAALEARVKASKSEAAKATNSLKKVQQKRQVLEMELNQLQEETSGLEDAVAQADKSVEVAREESELLAASVKEKEALHQAAIADVATLKGELTKLERDVKELKRQGAEAAKRKEVADLELTKLQHKLQRFEKDREAAEKFVSQMLRKHPWIAKEKGFFGKEGTDYDFSSRDTAAAQKRLKQLQSEQSTLGKKINKKVMGMIEKAESEYLELMRKKTVIETDKEKIYRVINELDQKKQQALNSTWVKVNRDFGSIFSTLLPGTSAKLEPPEGKTVFEGLEVKVAFGKVWKESLTELSGGQRSLLALSLILSLLLFKPAPMYILDEVDAALDLSHTQNIGTMLKTHFSHSQFIVVSLKEGMFNNANVIFRTKFVDGNSCVTRTVNKSSMAMVKAGSKGGAPNKRQRGGQGEEENEPVAAAP
jgi:structural maintenance of chromosome 2